MNNELDQASIRTWLKQMPDAGVFKDDVWLACDDKNEWYAFSDKPTIDIYNGYFFAHGIDVDLYSKIFNMPELSGDQWKYSCISVIELAEWQMENK